MRSLLLAGFLAVAACGGAPKRSTTPAAQTPTATPSKDLADARGSALRDPGTGQLVVKDPRIVDLDIIRITATSRGPGGDPQVDHVATGDLFKEATTSAKGGETERAVGIYRRLVTEFPESHYAPTSLFNIAAIYDGRRDLPGTIAVLRELVKAYPQTRESIEGHLYIAALYTDKGQLPDALATLDEVLARTNLTYADRIEGFARRGYILLELTRLEEAETALESAVAEWRKLTKLEDTYYIAMASYYRGEIMHRRFVAAPVRLPDDQLVADLEAKRVFAVKAYDFWRESLQFKQAYWATASGYQMSHIFVELWEAHVKAPYPARIDVQTRPTYVREVHDRVREHLDKALEGHRMNVELGKAYGVETAWSRASAEQAIKVMELLERESRGVFVTPAS
jgi:tetratricopeptide (TPR) repeat protein